MTKNKMNNLLVNGKKIALLAMFAVLPFANINTASAKPAEELTEEEWAKIEQFDEIALRFFLGIMFVFGGGMIYYVLTEPGKVRFNWAWHKNSASYSSGYGTEDKPKKKWEFVSFIKQKVKEKPYKRVAINKPTIKEDDFAKCPSTVFDTKLQSLFLSYLKINIGSYLQKRLKKTFNLSDYKNHDFSEEINNAQDNLLTNIQTWLSKQPKNKEIETIKNYVLYMNWKQFLNNCKDSWHPVFVKDKIFSDSGTINKSALEQYIQTSWTNIAQQYKDMLAGMTDGRIR